MYVRLARKGKTGVLIDQAKKTRNHRFTKAVITDVDDGAAVVAAVKAIPPYAQGPDQQQTNHTLIYARLPTLEAAPRDATGAVDPGVVAAANAEIAEIIAHMEGEETLVVVVGCPSIRAVAGMHRAKTEAKFSATMWTDDDDDRLVSEVSRARAGLMFASAGRPGWGKDTKPADWVARRGNAPGPDSTGPEKAAQGQEKAAQGQEKAA